MAQYLAFLARSPVVRYLLQHLWMLQDATLRLSVTLHSRFDRPFG